MEEALKQFEQTLNNNPLEHTRYYAVIERLENMILKRYLEEKNYSIARSAEYLGMNRSTLSMRMIKLGVINLALEKKGMENEKS